MRKLPGQSSLIPLGVWYGLGFRIPLRIPAKTGAATVEGLSTWLNQFEALGCKLYIESLRQFVRAGSTPQTGYQNMRSHGVTFYMGHRS